MTETPAIHHPRLMTSPELEEVLPHIGCPLVPEDAQELDP
jgi:hypothetical protein